MKQRDELGTRMKEIYETVPKTGLVRWMIVTIWVDRKTIHTFTRGISNAI